MYYNPAVLAASTSSMTKRELQIGIVGTFDVENYGDLLFPLIAEVELSHRLGPMSLHRFSYHQKTARDWPFAVTSLSELASQVNDLDALLIGGGHILRFDKGAVGPGYLPPGLRVHHPTGYWLAPALIALDHGLPVAWNAPGVCGAIPDWAEPLMKLAINGSSYVAVRDHDSQEALERFADDETEVRVVPDTAFGLARLVDTRCAEFELAQRRLRRPYIIVQATRDLLPFADFVRSHPNGFKAYDLLVLETGPALGDDDEMFCAAMPGALRLPKWPSPLSLAELVSHADAVVAVSLHLSISALAFGVPLFLSDRAVDRKYEILSRVEGVVRFDDEAGIDPQVFASMPSRSGPSPFVLAALRQLENHWDNIASVFAAESSETRNTREAISDFWQTIPGLLESHQKTVNELAVRNKKIADINNSTSWKVTAPLRSFADRWRR